MQKTFSNGIIDAVRNIRQKNKIALIIAAIFISVFSTSFAQTETTDNTATQKAELQRQLDAIQQQIDAYQQQLNQIQGQSKTLQNKISQLKKQQASLNLQVQITNMQLSAISDQMEETQKKIDDNSAKLQQLKSQLQDSLQAVYINDNSSLLYTLLSQESLVDAMQEMESFTMISDRLSDLAHQTLDSTNQLSEYKQELMDQQDQENNLLEIQNLQRQQLASATTEQNTLLQQTKGQESNYQKIISNTRAQADAIRNQLYQLLGVDTQITFGQALEIAQWASSKSGVRAAFLLAILTQESNLGKNVGTCNRPGDPPSKSYKVVMKPDRDINPFLQITASLGRDPETTPVSCPLKNKNGSFNGWGGAMGPAQFIPSTWMGYKDQVAAIKGSPADPWDIRDAFLASAIKLKSSGAGSQSGEWAAAMRYFSGGTNVRYRFYGDNVVALAANYQNEINSLNQ